MPIVKAGFSDVLEQVVQLGFNRNLEMSNYLVIFWAGCVQNALCCAQFEKTTMIDWNFIYDGMKSVHWIRNCNDLPEEFGDEAPSMTIGKVWERTFKPEDRDHRLLNNSVLMMAAYLYFVYPKERLKEIDLTNISINDFEIIEYETEHDKKKLIRRIRNSVAHANYEIENNKITFSDWKPHDYSDKIKFKIASVDFGLFIEQFRLEIYKQKIE